MTDSRSEIVNPEVIHPALPVAILKTLLETTACTVTLLDHHITAIQDIQANQASLAGFINSVPPRLNIQHLDTA